MQISWANSLNVTLDCSLILSIQFIRINYDPELWVENIQHSRASIFEFRETDPNFSNVFSKLSALSKILVCLSPSILISNVAGTHKSCLLSRNVSLPWIKLGIQSTFSVLTAVNNLETKVIMRKMVNPTAERTTLIYLHQNVEHVIIL